jgi:hypothetical protein
VTITGHTLVGMIAATALIGVASWIGRRWGSGAGGWFVALPLISGPIILTFALERGPSFAQQASLGAMLAAMSVSVFALVYARVARRAGWFVCDVIACTTFLACTWILQRVHTPSMGWTFLATCAVIAIALAATPTAPAPAPTVPLPPWDIPLRMTLAAALVWALASVSAVFGARVSGLLTPFPITSTILLSFIHHDEGPASVDQFVRGLLKGLFSFAVFLLVVGVAIESWSIAATFLAATVITLVFHVGVWWWVQRRPRAAGSPVASVAHE